MLIFSDVTMSVHHCPLPTRNMGNNTKTATGILIATQSTGKFIFKVKKEELKMKIFAIVQY